MRLYNTLSRSVEEFVPRKGNEVLMYTCGLTVYNHPQIGNWVAYIYSDVLTRVLVANGYNVKRIQNITDVGHLVSDDDSGEDKMQKGAAREGITAWEIAEKYSQIAEQEAYSDLKLNKPNKLVAATSQIEEQIAFAKKLEDKGFTYLIDGEGLYFDTSKLKDYGKLARLDIEGLDAGARVPIKGKKNITDFAIWKLSSADKKRDMEWESPWGLGFPGWHLECSTIAMTELGEQIDLHTGGIDHIPVHHTNELAQTEALTGKEFSKYWFHNNFLLVNDDRMAKSADNSYALSDITNKGFDLDAFKLLVLSSHYKTAGNFSWEILASAQNRLNNWRQYASLKWQTVIVGKKTELTDSPQEKLLKILSNDLDTPAALSYVDQFLAEASQLSDSKLRAKKLEDIANAVEALLGTTLQESDIANSQKKLMHARDAARERKEWENSDKIRDQLRQQGIYLKDYEDGAVWSRTE